MSDGYEQQEDEVAPFCAGEGAPSPTTSSRLRMQLSYLIPLFLIGALLSPGSTSLAQTRGTTHASGQKTIEPLTRQQVIDQAQPAVVQVIVANCQDLPQSSGSGVIIDRQGYIVTNYHVVNGGQKYFVILIDNSQLPAQLAGVDPADDLAVLKIDTSKHLFVMPIGNSSRLHVGDSVLNIGHPIPQFVNITREIGEVDGSTVNSGFISALGRIQSVPVEGVTSEIADAIQADAEQNPGDSGGALVDMQGQLIGILEQSPKYTPSDDRIPIKGIAFSIPSNRVAFVVPQLIQYGQMVHSGHATIGATLVSVTPALTTQDSLSVDHGAYISDVTESSPAAQAGLQAGDVIVQVNTTPLANALDLTDALMPLDAGTMVTLGIVRGTQQMQQVQAKLQELAISVNVAPIQQCPSSDTSVGGKG